MMASRGRSGKKWGSTLAIFSLSLAATGIPQSVPQAPQQPVIRVEVKQVLVPCVVTDRKGRYIKDLKEGNFHVYEDDVEQKIVAFSSNASGASNYFQPQPREHGGPLPEGTASSGRGEVVPNNTYVFCLDTLHSAFSSYQQIHRALERFFGGGLPAGAQYALVTVGRQTRILQNLTRDPAAILVALRGKEFTGAIKESETATRAAEETELVNLLNEYCRRCRYMTPEILTTAGNTDECQRDWLTIELWANARTEARRPLEMSFLLTLRGIVEGLGIVPGKRTIILVTDGFNLQPGRELYDIMAAYTQVPIVALRNRAKNLEPELQQLLQAAQMRDVSFYTLVSRGVHTVSLSGFEIDQPARPGPWQVSATVPDLVMRRQAIEIDNQAVLKQLATDTGGDFFHNSNNFLKGLQQTLDDGEAYYLLAYIPTTLVADGKFHKIRVEVDETNAIVRTKKGYWAPVVGKADR